MYCTSKFDSFLQTLKLYVDEMLGEDVGQY